MPEPLRTKATRRPQSKPAPVDAGQVKGLTNLWDQKGNLIGTFHMDDLVYVTVEQGDGSRITGRLSIVTA